MKLHSEPTSRRARNRAARAVWRQHPRTALSLLINRPRWWTHIYPEAPAPDDVWTVQGDTARRLRRYLDQIEARDVTVEDFTETVLDRPTPPRLSPLRLRVALTVTLDEGTATGLTPIRSAFGPGCQDCDGTGHVCSDDGTGPGFGTDEYPDGCPPGHHGDTLHPWEGLSSRADACDHGGGMPCPTCSPDPTSSDGEAA